MVQKLCLKKIKNPSISTFPCCDSGLACWHDDADITVDCLATLGITNKGLFTAAEVADPVVQAAKCATGDDDDATGVTVTPLSGYEDTTATGGGPIGVVRTGCWIGGPGLFTDMVLC